MILGQLPNVPTDGLANFLKYGQFGAALAMLVLGFYLHWQASSAPAAEIESRKGVAQQFMLFAVAFFILCLVGEAVKMKIDSQQIVNEQIITPPLSASNFEKYGKVEIVKTRPGEEREEKDGSSEPQPFSIHEGTIITVNLQNVIDKFEALRWAKQSVENNIPKTIPDVGPGAPQ